MITEAIVEQGKQTMNVETIEAIAEFIQEPGVGSEGNVMNDVEKEDSHSKVELVTNVLSLNQSPVTLIDEHIKVIIAEDDLLMNQVLNL